MLFQKPLPIDIKKTTTIDTPDDFKDEIKDAKIEVLPLARDSKAESLARLVHLHLRT